MKGKGARKSKLIKSVDKWLVTYGWATMGNLLGSLATRLTKVAMAGRLTDRQGKDGAPTGPQALVIRRLEVATGSVSNFRENCQRAAKLVKKSAGSLFPPTTEEEGSGFGCASRIGERQAVLWAKASLRRAEFFSRTQEFPWPFGDSLAGD